MYDIPNYKSSSQEPLSLSLYLFISLSLSLFISLSLPSPSSITTSIEKKIKTTTRVVRFQQYVQLQDHSRISVQVGDRANFQRTIKHF